MAIERTWISVADNLPEHNTMVAVKVAKEFAIAYYDKHRGFEADSSGYDIYADDDSGLEISLDGTVSHWMLLSD